MKKLETITVGSGGQTTIEFATIPQTYTDLLLVVSARTSTTSGDWSDAILKPNGSSSNGTERYLAGFGSGSPGSASNAYIDLRMNTSATTSNTFSSYSVYIPNYAGSTYKSISIDGVTENNGTTALANIIANLWSNTSAITSLQLTSSSGNFVQYSTATLYGITKGSGGATVS